MGLPLNCCRYSEFVEFSSTVPLLVGLVVIFESSIKSIPKIVSLFVSGSAEVIFPVDSVTVVAFPSKPVWLVVTFEFATTASTSQKSVSLFVAENDSNNSSTVSNRRVIGSISNSCGARVGMEVGMEDGTKEDPIVELLSSGRSVWLTTVSDPDGSESVLFDNIVFALVAFPKSVTFKAPASNTLLFVLFMPKFSVVSFVPSPSPSKSSSLISDSFSSIPSSPSSSTFSSTSLFSHHSPYHLGGNSIFTNSAFPLGPKSIPNRACFES
mmetsp:Transcript_30184/g.63961  ORF Transcript_30184/g.63961 Transcript_30184/m.63961 type:complete len:268 (+) Transcript_30184:1662-2465(+)